MAQSDTLTILAIGFSIFFGALRMSLHRRFLPLLFVGGWIIVAIGCAKLVWDSPLQVKLTVGIGVVVFGVMAFDLAIEAFRSFNIASYIFLWERNGCNWDNDFRDPNVRLRLTDNETAEPVILSLAQQMCPARFTPVVQSEYDSIDEGMDIWITIYGKELKADNDQLGEWRQVLSGTTNVHQYWGTVNRTIHHGKSKIGPNGVIKVHFPLGDYRVEYKIEGISKKGSSFSKEGHFMVHIYDITL